MIIEEQDRSDFPILGSGKVDLSTHPPVTEDH
jgi:hypothetical protein